MLKLDFLSNFLMSTTISPISRSIRVSEELGSPSNSESFVATVVELGLGELFDIESRVGFDGGYGSIRQKQNDLGCRSCLNRMTIKENSASLDASWGKATQVGIVDDGDLPFKSGNDDRSLRFNCLDFLLSDKWRKE